MSHPLAALAASASGRDTTAAASSLSIAAGRLEKGAPIDVSIVAGRSETGAPIDDEVSGGGSNAAASSLSVVATRAPTDEDPGAMVSGGDTTTPVRHLLAAANAGGVIPPDAILPTCAVGCFGTSCDGHAGTFVPAAILAATASPAVANPYRASVTGVAATPRGGVAGRVVGAALGGSPVAVATGGRVGGAVGVAAGGPKEVRN